MGLALDHRRFALGAAVNGRIPRSADNLDFIPRDVMRQIIRKQMRPWRGLNRSVHEHFVGAEFLQLQSPPPLERIPLPEEFDQISDAKREFLEILAKTALEPTLRLAIYRIQSAIFSEEARKIHITIISPPKEALSLKGFLLRDFCAHGDPTHGNERYGRLMLNEILRLCVAPK